MTAEGDPVPGPGRQGRAGAVTPARRQVLLLLLGFVALVLGSVMAGSDTLGRILEPPFPMGVLLGTAMVIVGAVVLVRAAARVRGAREDATAMIRGVRLVFLAVGCFAAAAGWFVGSALPIVVGLIVIGIDVVETTFLLIVASARPDRPPPPPEG